MEQDGPGQLQPEGFVHFGRELGKQNVLVDRHKEIGKIEFQIPRRPGPVLGDGPDTAFQAFGGVQRAPAGYASAAAGHKASMEARGYLVVQTVMNNPITKFGSPDLAVLWPGDDKADGWTWAVLAGRKLFEQLAQVALQGLLESKCTGSVALSLAAVQIGLQ